MFSAADIKNLTQVFQTQVFLSDLDAADANYSTAHTRLVPETSGNGYLTLATLEKEITSVLQREHGRILMTRVATLLDVPVEYLQYHVLSKSSMYMLSSDKLSILTRIEYNELMDRLQDRTLTQVVKRPEFLKEENVNNHSALDLLQPQGVYSNGGRSNPRNGLHALGVSGSGRDYFYSDSFMQNLKAELLDRLQESTESAQIYVLPGSEMGYIPVPLLKGLANDCLNEISTTHMHVGDVTFEDGTLTYTPANYLKTQATEVLHALILGQRSYLNIGTFESLFATAQSVISQERLLAAVIFLPEDEPRWIVSIKAIQQWQDGAEEALSNNGWVLLDLQSSDVPEELEEGLHPIIAAGVVARNPDNVFSIENDACVITQNLFQRLSERAEEGAREQAHENAAQKAPGNTTVARRLDNRTLARRLAKLNQLFDLDLVLKLLQGTLSDKMEAAYADEVANLALRIQGEMTVLWREKVSDRLHLHLAALDAIDDAKIKDQLSAVLYEYVVKNLVPEFLTKARSRNLVGRHNNRDVEKFEEKLSGSITLDQAAQAVKKFGAKINADKGSEEEAHIAKEAYLGDLQRTMQKDTDNPRLFLTMVIIMHAKYQTGILYATGKQAPRVVKLLKKLIPEEQFEEIETLKGKVKAGAITPDDQGRMRELAGAE